MSERSTEIPGELARKYHAIGLRWDDDTLVLGMRSSLSDEEFDAALNELAGHLPHEVSAIAISDDHLFEVIDFIYRDMESAEDRPIAVPDSDSEGPIAELVSDIINRAVRMRASDIHVEPSENRLLVRIRVDGQLEELATLPSSVSLPFVSRLKVLARINIVERRRPQDGQFSLEVAGRTIDIRLATVATLFGEKAVMRILDTARALTDLEGLGMSGHHFETFSKMIGSQHGLIIAAGPTGSGKTTTLHSALHEINARDRNVVSIEDPVEYVMKDINHIPVADDIGVTFAVQLRAILRQDPDVILVGETRDTETARISVQAALSGRLVMTSLHATDALAAVYRLYQMEIEPYLVAASLRGVVSQRLVRRVCDYCSEEYKPSASDRLILKDFVEDMPSHLIRGSGCTICRGSGFRDRVGVYQILNVSDEMRELISLRPEPAQLQRLATKEGLTTLAREAYALAASGLTTIEEATRLVATNVK